MNVLILANGEPPDQKLFDYWHTWADFFIAADGGGTIAESFHTHPDLLIGDLDSYQLNGNEPFRIIKDPDQYSNDLEKALHAAAEENATEVVVLGATGHRLDHTLKNLSVLKQFDNHFSELCLADNYGTTFLAPSSYETDLAIGTTISLFPLSGAVTGITTQGLQYPLTDGELRNGQKDGSSNAVTSSPVRITHAEGDLLIFIAE